MKHTLFICLSRFKIWAANNADVDLLSKTENIYEIKVNLIQLLTNQIL